MIDKQCPPDLVTTYEVLAANGAQRKQLEEAIDRATAEAGRVLSSGVEVDGKYNSEGRLVYVKVTRKEQMKTSALRNAQELFKQRYPDLYPKYLKAPNRSSNRKTSVRVIGTGGWAPFLAEYKAPIRIPQVTRTMAHPIAKFIQDSKSQLADLKSTDDYFREELDKKLNALGLVPPIDAPYRHCLSGNRFVTVSATAPPPAAINYDLLEQHYRDIWAQLRTEPVRNVTFSVGVFSRMRSMEDAD